MRPSIDDSQMIAEPLSALESGPLESAVLAAVAHGYDPLTIGFLRPPSLLRLDCAVASLLDHGILDEHGAITSHGRHVYDLPCDIATAQMVRCGRLHDRR